MFKKILVALDRSEHSEQIFAEVLDLAGRQGAALLLVHVLSGDEEMSPGQPEPPLTEYYPFIVDDESYNYFHRQWEHYRRQGLDMLNRRVEEARATGLSAECAQTAGNAGSRICALARSWGADLIVTGRRGRTGLGELLLGSTSNYVLHHAPCAVLVLNVAAVPAAPQRTVQSTVS